MTFRRPSCRSAILLPAVALLALALTSAGCAEIQTQRRDWSGYTGPGAQYFHQEEVELPQGIRDPAQPFNRGLYAVNDWLMEWIIEPVSAGWRFVFPKTVREHIGKFTENLAFPTRALNQLAQGEPGMAGTETSRFLINTTVGILGFFDPAESWGIEAPRKEDTGQSLQAAGWEDPAYLFLPLQGPSTTRDGVGLIGDTLTNIAFWIGGPILLVGTNLNRSADLSLTYEQLAATSADPYSLMRLAWSVLRGAQVEDYPTKPTKEGVAGQTLQAVFFRPMEADFFRTADNDEVLMPTTGRELPFSYWLQDGQAPVLYIIPGLGSHRLSNQPLAMADAAIKQGWSVVIISSPLHPEFMTTASTAPVPGFAPVDCYDIRVAFDAIDKQLSKEEPGRLGPRALVGISMGAFEALYIAAEQEREPANPLLRFDLVGVGAPPVSLEYGVSQLDAFYNTAMAWPAADRDRHVLATLKRVAALSGGDLRPGDALPFSEEEARFLVGISFRVTLIDLLWASQQRVDLHMLQTPRDPDDRTPAYREMLEYSWMEYFYAFVLPWATAQGLAKDDREVLTLNDLRTMKPWLAEADYIHVYMSDNDFLRRPEDNAFLHEIFPADRLHVTHGGAHLGNGWKADEMQKVMAELKGYLLKGAKAGAGSKR